MPKTDIPEVFARDVGKGRVVDFPWDIDRVFWEVLSVDHAKLLRNAVDWAGREPRPVSVIGPGTIDVTVWKQRGSMTVHLVNLTNPMMLKGPIREFIPTPPQKVSVRLPAGAKARKVQLLVSGLLAENAGSEWHAPTDDRFDLGSRGRRDRSIAATLYRKVLDTFRRHAVC